MWFVRRNKIEIHADVRRFVSDAAVLAFREIIPQARLLRAMHADAYALGYVLARLSGLTVYACEEADLHADADALCDAVQADFLGPDAPALLAHAAVLAADPHYRQGKRDGQEQCDYLFGRRDVRTHPRYADAAALERAIAAMRPDSRYQGADVAVAQQLEKYTFGVYLLKYRADPGSTAELTLPAPNVR